MGRRTRQEVLMPEFQMVIDVSARKNGHHDHLPSTFVKGMKQADIPIVPSCATVVERFKDGKAARRFGERIGRVLSCQKVDIHAYHLGIEYLNFEKTNPKVIPVEIEIDKQEFTLGKDFEISKEDMKLGEFEK